MSGRKDYRTRQRDAILRVLQRAPGGCPSAAEIYTALCRAGEPVGRTTVYRALEQLAARGELLVLPAQDKNGARYQIRSAACGRESHIHLQCERCGRVIHLDCGLAGRFSQHLLTEHGFAINREKLILYGLCAACAQETAHE